MTELQSSRPRAVGYARVSTDEQSLSIEAQQHRIARWCEAYDHELVEIITDEDVSGGVPLAGRQNGKRVAELIDARRPGVDALVVTNLDRLSRDAEDGIALVKRMTPNGRRRNHLALVSIDQHLDLSGPFGVFMAQQFVLFASFERSLIGWRTSQALAQKRRDGAVYSRTPFGFDAVDGRLVPNDAEQQVLTEMRTWRAEGVNDNAIATRLNERGVPGKRGGRWQANTVYRILAAGDPESVPLASA